MMTSNEEDPLTHEVSDDALEAAGGNAARNFTMAAARIMSGVLAKIMGEAPSSRLNTFRMNPSRGP